MVTVPLSGWMMRNKELSEVRAKTGLSQLADKKLKRSNTKSEAQDRREGNAADLLKLPAH